jgi:predicted  nucleic acid-binding Zn-ribbon protein
MHKCVRCGREYEDNDTDIIRGCRACGSIFFLYANGPSDASVKQQQLDTVKQELEANDTTIEHELAKEIEKRKAEEHIPAGAAAAADAAGRHVEFETYGRGRKVASGTGKKPGLKPRAKAKDKSGARKAAAANAKPARRTVVEVGEKKFALEDIFGIETVRMPKAGVYEINIDALMKKRPVIVLERGGIYVIHLPQVFQTESLKR